MVNSRTIVLIHGLFVNNITWASWKSYFDARGYTCHTPANPFHEGEPAQLRAHHPPQLPKLSFEDVLNNIVRYIDGLPEKPIVIGHSLAGLLVMKLIEMEKAVAGVSIDGAPPKNVVAPWPTIRIVYPVVDFLKGNSVFMGSRKWYGKAFFNTLPEEEAIRAYDQFAVPESRRVARDTLLKSIAKVNFKKAHAPLLFIGGEKDNIFPASFSKRIASKYKDKNSTTDFKEFKGRSHFICGQEGWEEIASYIIKWLEMQSS